MFRCLPRFPALFACRWRTVHGCGQGGPLAGGEARRLWPSACLCMRPLCERGKDSISEQTSHPGTQSGQYSGPAAREAELIVWLQNPPPPLTSSLFSFALVCFFYGTQLLSPPACLWPSYPTLFLQPFHCPVIKVLLPLAFFGMCIWSLCTETVTVWNVFINVTFGEKDTLSTKQLLHSHWRRAHSGRGSFAAMVTPLPCSRAEARLRCTAYLSSRTKRPLMRRLQGGGSKRQANPLCQTAGGACAAGRWPDECRHGGKRGEEPRKWHRDSSISESVFIPGDFWGYVGI